MTIQKRRGDLLSVKRGIIVHGCNAQGVMGSGVAKAIRERWPGAYSVYREAFFRPEGLALGEVSFFQADDHLWVANAITQQFFGRERRRYVDYDAVSRCFERVAQHAKQTGLTELHFPLIGCGLGGGAWPEVEPRIVAAAPGCELNLWVL